MLKSIFGVAAGLLLTHGAVAEPAIFRDEVLWIPHGAAVIDGEISYYNDVFLEQSGQELVLQSADPGLPRGGPFLQDEGAIYADGELWIDNGAIIPGDGAGRYFSEVVLQENEDGNFVVSTLTEETTATIDEIPAVSLVQGAVDTFAVLRLEGRLATPCHQLLPPAISVNPNTQVITVVIADSDLTSAEAEQPQVCAQVLEPFTREMFLPVTGLAEGSWTVWVNGMESVSFEL